MGIGCREFLRCSFENVVVTWKGLESEVARQRAMPLRFVREAFDWQSIGNERGSVLYDRFFNRQTDMAPIMIRGATNAVAFFRMEVTRLASIPGLPPVKPDA